MKKEIVQKFYPSVNSYTIYNYRIMEKKMLIARRREQSAKRPDEPACLTQIPMGYARLKRLKVFYFVFFAAFGIAIPMGA